MSTQPAPNTKHTVRVTENVAKILRDKDRIIKLQAKRIELLERDVDKLRKERDSLSTKVTLLSYKLQVNGAANGISSDNASESCNKTGSRARSGSSTSQPLQSGVFDLKQRSASLSAPPTPVARVRKSPSVCAGHTPTGTGSLKLHRQRSYKRNEEEEKVRKSRGWANAYELSQDLHDKQLELLQRKYGGNLRTRRAACVIQHAYRQHCMNKNFQKLCSEVEENRLSRRFSEFGRSKTIWSDMVVTIENSLSGMNGDGEFHSERYIGGGQEVGSGGQGIHVRTTSSQSAVKTAVRVMQKSYSLNLASHDHAHYSKEQRRPLRRSTGVDLSAIDESGRPRTQSPLTMTSPRPAVWPHEANNNRSSYMPELNDSSASDGSPQETLREAVVDLPSVNFEQLLESKETAIVNDSFHNDQARLQAVQTGGLSTACTCSHTRTGSNDYAYPTFSPGGTPSPSDISYEDFRTPSFPNGMGKHVEIKVEDMCEDYLTNSSHNGDMSDDDTLTRIYANTEVHLRKRRDLPGDDADANGVSSEIGKKQSPEASPIWKRKSMGSVTGSEDMKRMSNISETSEPDSVDGLLHSGSADRLSSSASSSDTTSLGSEMSTYNRSVPAVSKSSRRGHHSSGSSGSSGPSVPPKVTDRQRKRAYRIGLNLFNKKPEKGIKYLVEKRFIDDRPRTVAKFLITRKGLSKQIIGEYLGNLQKEFNCKVLECFVNEVDLSGLQVDVALRLFQTYFRMPGEAQKIERLMEAFATRYCECNPEQVKKFQTPSSIFLLAFAIIMLNTDLHNKNIKAERRMKLPDFIKNLRGLDNGEDMDMDLLTGIYTRIQASEFKPGTDHVTQVMKVEEMIVGKCPPLALSHRRLVCYCRLYEVHDPNKREKLGLHQREVFLFNDILMVTKILSKKKGIISYSFRQSFPLCGVQVYLFETPHYQFGIRLTTNIDNKILITFNARNEHDRCKFVEDIKEAIIEMNEMEAFRIAEELHRQTISQHSFNRHSKDSGVIDIDVLTPGDTTINRLSAPECRGLKKNTLSNSLIDLSEGGMRRGSGGSLDSGMASTSSGSNGSREIPTNGKQPGGKPTGGERADGGNSSRFNLFGKKAKTSKTSVAGVPSNMSEV